MIYADGCLVRGFERQLIGITNCSEGWGVVAVVHLPTDNKAKRWGLKPEQHKQDFKKTEEYLKIVAKLRSQYDWYELYGKMQEGEQAKAHLLGNEVLLNTEWIQCEQCSKWRIVDKKVVSAYRGYSPFYCHNQDSPVMLRLLRRGCPEQLARRQSHLEPADEEDECDVTTHMRTSAGEMILRPMPETSATAPELEPLPEVVYHAVERSDRLVFGPNGDFVEIRRHRPASASASASANNLALHVKNGSGKKFASKFVSCTKSFRWALYFCQREAENHNHRPLIMEIDVSKVCYDVRDHVFDVSTVPAQAMHCKGTEWAMAKNFALDAEEVIFDVAIPQAAVVGVYDLSKAEKTREYGSVAGCFIELASTF